MRYLPLLTLLIASCPTARLDATSFDYYIFSLSWSPEYCHEHPTDKTPECNAQAKMNFVVHGLWPSNKNGSNPTGCSKVKFSVSAVPAHLEDIMPSSIFQHEWQTHGVCSGMTESVYFQKIISLFGSLAIPVKNTGQDQSISPVTLRQEFSQVNAGTTPQSFAIEDSGGDLTEVRSCWDRSFKPITCPAQGDTRSTSITIRAKPQMFRH